MQLHKKSREDTLSCRWTAEWEEKKKKKTLWNVTVVQTHDTVGVLLAAAAYIGCLAALSPLRLVHTCSLITFKVNYLTSGIIPQGPRGGEAFGHGMLTCCILKWATTEAVTVRWRVMIAEFYPLSRAEKGTFVLCFRKLTATPATMMNILQIYIPPVIQSITTKMQMTPRWLRAVVTWITALRDEDTRYYVAEKTILVTVETPIRKVQLLASCSHT